MSGQVAPLDDGFNAIVGLIQASQQRAMQAVNTALIDLYWQVGAVISGKIAAAEWGDGVVDRLAAHIARVQPGLRGFTPRNLLRMRQFHEAYVGDAIATPGVSQIPWTHNLVILSQSKRPEEREFYLRMAAQEGWSKRELERQFRLALFERTVLLCASKDDEVVEYALSRSASAALIAEYQTQLPDKALLQAKLHEFYLLADGRVGDEA